MVNPLSQLELPDGPNYEEDANAKTVYTHIPCLTIGISLVCRNAVL